MTKIKFYTLRLLMLSIFASLLLFTACNEEEDPVNNVVANFTYVVSETNTLEVTFTNTSENATVYAWNFGDENTSAEESPVHTYTAAGTYTVELIASDADDNSNTKTVDVTVEANPVNEAELLVTYLEETGAVNTFPVMIKATDVYNNILAEADQYIIDIRSAEDWAAGHIQGAHNVTSGEVLTHYEANSLADVETVVIVCYSGQTAGWVNGLLHTLGYTNCKDMKYGMSSWTYETSGSWVNNISNEYDLQLVTDVTAKADEGDFPVLTTEETDASDILRARVEAIFAEGFGEAKVGSATVFGATDNYYIVNYWSEADYSWGHIPGAIQYTPKADLTSDAFLKTLPTDKTVAVYCYTGQTSAHVTAYLRVLGYDAKSILFGVNGLAHDTMPGTVFNDDTTSAECDIHDYPFGE